MLRTSDVANNKWLFIGAMAAVVIWFLAFEIADRLPYLYTPFAFNIRAYLVAPAILVVMVWFTLIHTWGESGKTGYRMAMDGLPSRKERIKQTLLGSLGLVAVPAGLAWTLIAFPILAAYLSASQPYAEVFRADYLKAYGNRYDLWMTHPATGEEVALRQSREQVSEQRRGWNPGDLVCARGRTSVFGTLIESLSRDLSACSTLR